MKDKYCEKEVKILDINLQKVKAKLEDIGALKVYDDERTWIHFDYRDKSLSKSKKELRLTLEDKLKLSLSQFTKGNKKETIKLFVSREEELTDLFKGLGLIPISKCKSYRTSYEWEGIDFDIDEFPKIPTFMEIDLANTDQKLSDILKLLDLKDKKITKKGTLEIYRRYGFDYLKLFKI